MDVSHVDSVQSVAIFQSNSQLFNTTLRAHGWMTFDFFFSEWKMQMSYFILFCPPVFFRRKCERTKLWVWFEAEDGRTDGPTDKCVYLKALWIRSAIQNNILFQNKYNSVNQDFFFWFSRFSPLMKDNATSLCFYGADAYLLFQFRISESAISNFFFHMFLFLLFLYICIFFCDFDCFYVYETVRRASLYIDSIFTIFLMRPSCLVRG